MLSYVKSSISCCHIYSTHIFLYVLHTGLFREQYYHTMNILSLHHQCSLLSCCKLHDVLFCSPFTSSSCQITPSQFYCCDLFSLPFSLFYFPPPSVHIRLWVYISFVFDCYCDLLRCSEERRSTSHTWFFLFPLCPEGPIDWLMSITLFSLCTFLFLEESTCVTSDAIWNDRSLTNLFLCLWLTYSQREESGGHTLVAFWMRQMQWSQPYALYNFSKDEEINFKSMCNIILCKMWQ